MARFGKSWGRDCCGKEACNIYRLQAHDHEMPLKIYL